MRLQHILLVILVACACTRIQETRIDAERGQDFTLDVTIDDLAARSAYTLDGGSLKCSWNAGDSITVLSLHNGAVASYDIFTTQSGGRTASFSGRFSGALTDPVVAVYPVLKGTQGVGYYSNTAPGNQNGFFYVKRGDSSISFCPSAPAIISQSAYGNYDHIGYGDLMTGTVDINTAGGSVTLTKHSAVLKVVASIASLPSTEKVETITLKLSEGTPFTNRAATLPIVGAAGVWTTSTPCDSVTVGFGNYLAGSFSGVKASSTTLTAYVPVWPNSTTTSLQGSAQRKLTVTVTTNNSIYSGGKTIPAKSGTDAYPLTAGTINTVNASLVRTGDADPELTEWVRSVNSVADVDAKAAALKKAILESPSQYNITGTTYYVSSSEGNDYFNSGTSPSSPYKSIDKVNSLSLNKGDGVLFKRGDTFRGKMSLKNGVTYSAYGTGNKPRIYGSPYNAATTGSWNTTGVANVYKYSNKVTSDVGTLVFNNGDDGCAYKVIKMRDYQNNTFHPVTMETFNGWEDLKRDRDMWHDLETGYIYLCSTAGKPSTRWSSIELNTKGNVFDGWGNNGISVVIDNLCVMYTGSHGVGTGSVKSLIVTNCVFGWIGGSIQQDNAAPTTAGTYTRPTRYGNGVEIYGTCQEFKVENCWIYQCYDAGVTHQYSDKSKAGIYCDNVTYKDNLIERCVYAIEYWVSVADQYLDDCGMRNFLIRGNIMRLTGGDSNEEWSWGYQRTNKDSPAVIKTWNNKNRAINFRMEKNIIDRGKPTLLNIKAGKTEWLPECRANVYLHVRTATIGDMIETNPKLIYVN